MAEPSVRARHLRNALALAGSLPGAAALRAAIPARVLAEVEAATGSDPGVDIAGDSCFSAPP